MKANLETLKKALQLCAKAHKVEFCDWSDEEQLAIKSEDTPVANDMRMILDAFFGYRNYDLSVEWGYCNVFLNDEYLDNVNEMSLNFALPSGWTRELVEES